MKRVYSIILLLILSLQSFAFENQSIIFERATTLLDHHRYTDARHEAMRLDVKPYHFVSIADRDYITTLCDVKLGDNNAEKILLNFIVTNPTSIQSSNIHYNLGLYYISASQYDKARAEFEKVNYKTLSNADKSQYDVQMGYIEFRIGNFEKAEQYFNRIPKSNQYYEHATYYRGYMAYKRGDYDRAYSAFYSLNQSQSYSKIVPYSLLQVEFARSNYAVVVREGDDVIASTIDSKKRDAIRIVAIAWYYLGGYNKAISYLKQYQKLGGEIGRVEEYIFGFCYYSITDYQSAVKHLLKVCNTDDLLAQNGAYHLADSYIHLRNKTMAQSAFSIASSNKYDNTIAQNALFNSALLLFESDNNHFNEAINTLTTYLKRYPKADKAPQAKQMLVAAYYNSHNYDMALEAIRQIENPDASISTAKQKIAFFKAVQALKEDKIESAKYAFEEALNIGVSPKYNALCTYWLGEIAYISGDYEKATQNYNYYLKKAPKTELEYMYALYGLGYTYLFSRHYADSKRSFEGFVWLYKQRDDYRADAYARLGDLSYTLGDFDKAVTSYSTASAIGTPTHFYTDYQKSIALGFANKLPQKIEQLCSIIKSDVGEYVDDSYYELGKTYIEQNQFIDGVTTLEQLLQKFEDTPYILQSKLYLGSAYNSMGEDTRSLSYYDEIIKVAPQSQTAKQAIMGVRDIYVNRGDADTYFRYAEKSGVECDLSAVARDSLSFSATAKIYSMGDKERSISSLRTYLNTYTKGYYIDNALYYLADDYIQTDSLDCAVATLNRLADRPKSTYTEPALESLATITYQNRMYEASATACYKYYNVATTESARTKAAHGYVDATIKAGVESKILEMNQAILAMPEIEQCDIRQAKFAKATILDKTDKNEALQIYTTLATDVSDQVGSASKYRVIEELYKSGKYEECEKSIYEFADAPHCQTYWLGRAFILLGDSYIERNDLFQARATYRRIIDGYSPADDGVVEIATQRLNKMK